MTFRYTIPEISAISLLSAAVEKDGVVEITYDADTPSRAHLVKWTQQDDCPMFYQAVHLLWDDLRWDHGKEDTAMQICWCPATTDIFPMI